MSYGILLAGLIGMATPAVAGTSFHNTCKISGHKAKAYIATGDAAVTLSGLVTVNIFDRFGHLISQETRWTREEIPGRSREKLVTAYAPWTAASCSFDLNHATVRIEAPRRQTTVVHRRTVTPPPRRTVVTTRRIPAAPVVHQPPRRHPAPSRVVVKTKKPGPASTL